MTGAVKAASAISEEEAASTTGEEVVTSMTGEEVVSSTTGEEVVASTASEETAASTTAEEVVASTTVEAILTGAAAAATASSEMDLARRGAVRIRSIWWKMKQRQATEVRDLINRDPPTSRSFLLKQTRERTIGLGNSYLLATY